MELSVQRSTFNTLINIFVLFLIKCLDQRGSHKKESKKNQLTYKQYDKVENRQLPFKVSVSLKESQEFF